MTLPAFILDNVESILDDWTRFARSIPTSQNLDIESLRDHAEVMLRTIAQDMLTEQSADEQQAKSEGNSKRLSSADTAAEEHGTARRRSGFELVQMVAEYRALRATVVRQWLLKARPSGPEAMLELIRFNEGIDQALTESLARFVKEVDEARELFLGIIAHDMRSPIGACLHAAQYLKRAPGLDTAAASAVDVVLRSNERLSRLTTDILELVELRLHHIPHFSMAPVNIEALCGSVIAALRMSRPNAPIRLEVTGDMNGVWDAAKLERVLANLVENALKHGASTEPVTVSLRGEPDTVELTVWNAGEPIPAERLGDIFEPLAAWAHRPADKTDGTKSYGLGLFIAREIVRGHSGSLTVESCRDEGTTFRVRLPRHASSPTSAESK